MPGVAESILRSVPERHSRARTAEAILVDGRAGDLALAHIFVLLLRRPSDLLPYTPQSCRKKN